MLPGEILRKMGEFSGVEEMQNLIATCKYLRNQLDTLFLQALASEKYPDRATSGFIVDAIGDKGNTCLWRNTKFFYKGPRCYPSLWGVRSILFKSKRITR